MTNGSYQFNQDFLKDAHSWCFNKTKYNLLCGFNVVVSNTFIRWWELEKYIYLKNYIEDLEIEVMTFHNDFGSIHEVKEEKMNEIRKGFDKHTNYIKNVLVETFSIKHTDYRYD